jgi:hypothetical protein
VTSYAYRLPRKYRYRGYRRSGGQDKAIGAAVAVVLAAAAAGGTAKGAAHHGATAVPASLAAARGGTLGCAGLERLWEQAGGSRGTALMAAEIAMAESGGRQYSSLYNTNGTTDRGYWQVNSVHGSLSAFGAQANARAAVLLSRDGRDWSPWTTYNTGAYAGRC